jgi:hypothetical protein
VSFGTGNSLQIGFRLRATAERDLVDTEMLRQNRPIILIQTLWGPPLDELLNVGRIAANQPRQ